MSGDARTIENERLRRDAVDQVREITDLKLVIAARRVKLERICEKLRSVGGGKPAAERRRLRIRR